MHDKKSDYVGNHGGAYTDLDGMSKQFTYIDHDVKTKISTYMGQKSENMSSIEEKSELETLSEHIVSSGIGATQVFKDGFDRLGKKYSYERYDKLAAVQVGQINAPHYGEAYVNDIKKLYDKARRRAKKLQD